MTANALIFKRRLVALSAAWLVVPAVWCSTPDSMPPVDLPAQFEHGRASAPSSMHSDWWNRFGDPELNVLVQRALRENPGITSAAARIAAARAHRGIADARFAPQLSSGSSVSREQRSGNDPQALAADTGGPHTLYRTAFDASWEIDLFGARAATRRQSAAEIDAVAADRDAVRLMVAAETATVYVEHALYAQRARTARRELELRQQALALIEQQHAAGEVSSDTVSEARKLVASAAALVPRWEAEADARRYAMAELLGIPGSVELPSDTPILVSTSGPLRAAADHDVGLPSDLLRRRPDIRRADAQWREAQAAHDVAIADQYPRFSLVGGLGRESISSGSLLDAASRVWSLGPQLSLPLFDGGRRKSAVAGRAAEMDAATASYKQAVLAAVSDVEQAIMRYQGAASSMSFVLTSLQEAERVLEIEEQRHAWGETARVELLAERARFESEVSKSLDAKQHVLLSFIALNKALGGGLP
jgi:NodT family efflux transporter outer membrane factor (OMF) lipoprotein